MSAVTLSSLAMVRLSLEPLHLHVLPQARFFREQDIDEFRECFYLYARSVQMIVLHGVSARQAWTVLTNVGVATKTMQVY